jgi:hypothetical protein
MRDRNYRQIEIEPCLPARNAHHRTEPIPPGLVGATIVDIGAAPEQLDVEGGGLVIDYRPQGSDVVRRLVLAFNEIAMWVEEEIVPVDSAERGKDVASQ